MVSLIAQVSQQPVPFTLFTLIGMFIPWAVLGSILGSILAVIAPRKGSSSALWFFLGFIPIVGFYSAFVLVSRTDVAVLDRLRQLEEQLKQQREKT